MKFARSTLTISLLLNLILLAAAGILFSRPTPKPVGRVVMKTVVSNENVSEAATNLPLQVLETKTNALFDWSMVSSADLEVYVKNLRAIGCPKDTIRDIITGEVDEIFLKKLAEKLDPLRQGFWTILANWKTQEKEVEEKFKGVEKLSDERNEMLKKLLGTEKDSTAEYNPAMEKRQERLNFLPKEKADQILALEKKNRDEKQKILDEAKKEKKPADERKIQALDKQLADGRKALMTPEEFEEYQLRGGSYSQFRNNVAMPEFNESEARTLAKIQMDFTQARAALPPESDPSYEAKRTEQTGRLQQQQKNALGEERYADYTRAWDNNFQQVYRVTERYDLPRDTAVKVYELQQSATKQANEFRNDKNLSDDDRAELLSALQQETQRSVNATLGGNAAQTYQKYGGQWLENLGDE